MLICEGDVAHMVERIVCIDKAQGSIPCISMVFLFLIQTRKKNG